MAGARDATASEESATPSGEKPTWAPMCSQNSSFRRCLQLEQGAIWLPTLGEEG